MQIEQLLKLKSGTDVRGVAVEGVNGEVTLTEEAVTLTTKAFAAWLLHKTGKGKIKIAVGHDPRVSSPAIYAAAVKALTSCGCDVLKTGLCSTPSMFMLLQKPKYGCGGSVMITASHLPYERNGLKFFTPEGGLSSADIVEILHTAADGNFPAGCGGIYEADFLSEYSLDLVDIVRGATGERLPLYGKKIIVDAGNGAGGFFVEKVLKPLGADTEGSLYLEPDGLFPNHAPNPEDKKAIKCLSDAVIKNCADFGIIFDTDVDRAACVDKNGDEINRNKLIALISAILLKEKSGVIVTDSVASDHLTEFIQSHGGKHLRYKRGYKNVIDKCKELNDGGVYSPLAIETSGHAAFAENYFLDDGAYLITRLLCCLAKSGDGFADIIKDLKQPAEEAEIRLSFTAESCDFRSEGAEVLKELEAEAAKMEGVTVASDSYEGVRLRFDGDHGCGWALLRMSVHDPVMPMNFESDKEGGIKIMAEKLVNILSRYPFLNIENLTNYLN